jgi:hypothetical protein
VIASTGQAPMAGGDLVVRFLADDPAVWRPALAELVARTWQPPAPPAPARAPTQAPETPTAAREGTAAPRESVTEGLLPLPARCDRRQGRCQGCGGRLTGRQRDFCSPRCRKRASRARHRHAVPVAEAGRWPA